MSSLGTPMTRTLILRSIALRASLLAFATFTLIIGAQAADAAPAPTAYTGEAAQLTSSSATLKGSVYPSNQQTTYYFQYGPTTAYLAQTPPTTVAGGTQSIHVTAVLGGLSAGTTYHYRLLATNPSGAAAGNDRAFTTRKVPLTFKLAAIPSKDRYATPFSVRGVLSGTDALRHPVVLQANPFPYLSGFKAITAPELTDAAGGLSFGVPGLLRNTQLRVATLDAPPVWSPVVIELVAVRVSLHVRATTRRGFARLYGTITPAEIGATVRLQLLRRGPSPLSVGSVVITNATRGISRFSRIVRVPHPGAYRALVHVPSGAQVSGHSPPVLVR